MMITRTCAALITLLAAACGSVEHPVVMSPAAHRPLPPTPLPEADPEPRGQPLPERGGWMVEGSGIFLPREAKPGEMVQGRAPAGSLVQFYEGQQVVSEDGSFVLKVPPSASGSMPVRITRPAGGTLVMNIRVEQ